MNPDAAHGQAREERKAAKNKKQWKYALRAEVNTTEALTGRRYNATRPKGAHADALDGADDAIHEATVEND